MDKDLISKLEEKKITICKVHGYVIQCDCSSDQIVDVIEVSELAQFRKDGLKKARELLKEMKKCYNSNHFEMALEGDGRVVCGICDYNQGSVSMLKEVFGLNDKELKKSIWGEEKK